MMQEIIVAVIVAAAAFAVLRRYAPRSVKQALRSHSVRLATSLGWHSIAAKLRARAENGAACGSGCGSCGSCGDTPAKQNTSSTSISVDALKRTIQR
jgi:hypothetical protein